MWRGWSVLCMIRGSGDRGDDDGGVDMKVLMTLYGEERGPQDFTPEQGAAEMAAWQAFDEAARAAGVLLACEGLAESHTATTVRVEGGRRQVTDGPFMETKEQLGGFIFLEVRDLDEAIAWSDRTPWNHDGCYTEIRPIMDYEGWEAEATGAEQTAS
jgi:hypothetical protein